MRSLKKTVTAGCLIIFLMSGSLPAHTQSAPGLDANKRAWNRLFYKAKKILGTVTTEIQWENLQAEEIKKLLIPVPGRASLQSTDNLVFTIEGHSVVKPLWGSVEVLDSQAWYNPGNEAVLQRIRSRRGKETWQKTYRFTNKGVFRLRKKPGNLEELNKSAVQWTDIRESFYPYALKTEGCSHALEPLVLLFVVSAIDLESHNGMLRLCVFNKKQLHEVRVRPEGTKSLAVDYIEKIKANEVRRQAEIEAVKWSIKPRSLAGTDKKPEPFSFLGLDGDFDIYMDKTSKIPVQISGRISGFGKVDIRLQKIEFSK